jgi:uncharacterized OsmC-like protein
VVIRNLVPVLAAVTALAGCASLSWRHSPERTVSNVLLGRGYDVEEVSVMTQTDRVPQALCGKAYATVFYRVRGSDGKQMVGVACYQRDGSVTFPRMPSRVM